MLKRKNDTQEAEYSLYLTGIDFRVPVKTIRKKVRDITRSVVAFRREGTESIEGKGWNLHIKFSSLEGLTLILYADLSESFPPFYKKVSIKIPEGPNF